MGIYDRSYYRETPTGPAFAQWSAVTTLIVVNSVVWLVGVTFGGVGLFLYNNFTLEPSELLAHPWRFYTLVTYGFLHDPNNIQHVLFNMLALWIFGRDVEAIYGRREFYRVYFSLIVTSALGYIVLQRLVLHQSAHPLIGASGGIMGIMLIYICHYPFRTFYYGFFLPVPAWLLGVGYVFFDVSGALHGGSMVAHGAHLAGAAFGFVYYRYHWSLASLLPSARWLRGFSRPRMRVYDERSAQSDDATLQQRVDQILAKITREGEASLTADERRTLEEASRRFRSRR